MRVGRYVPVGILAALVVGAQLACAAAGRGFYLTQLTMSAYYCVVVIGLCLLMGYAGQVSLGHAGFFAIGGYTSAVLTTLDLTPYAQAPLVRFLAALNCLTEWPNVYGTRLLSVAPWLAFLAALLAAAAIALVIGVNVIRLKGHYLAMGTLGFGVIVYQVIVGTALFGRSDGISGVPAFTLPGGLAVTGRVGQRVANYYLAWGLVLAAAIAAVNLVHSRVGRALRSIHDSEEAANALGVDTSAYKVLTFVLSAIFAATAGVFMTHYNASIGPSEASVLKSVRYVAIVAVGGMGNLWGVVLMGLVLNFLSLRNVFGTYDEAVFGAILIAVMLFAPSGVLNVPAFRRLAAWCRGGRHGERAA